MVPLNTVYQSQFTSLYKEIQGGKIDIHLQCPDGIDVYATLTDASQPVNRTDILTLSSESTAKGFGIRLYKDSDVTAISYGEDSCERKWQSMALLRLQGRGKSTYQFKSQLYKNC